MRIEAFFQMEPGDFITLSSKSARRFDMQGHSRLTFFETKDIPGRLSKWIIAGYTLPDGKTSKGFFQASDFDKWEANTEQERVTA